MKLTIGRQLSGGFYYVTFSVSDFTAEEVKQMESFGVPLIDLLHGGTGAQGRQAFKIPLNKVTPGYKASFSQEEQAKTYEQNVVAQIQGAMKALRDRKDDFSSVSEVEI